MGASIIVAVRAALVAALDALAAFDGVEVMYAYQGTTSREFVYTRNAKFTHEPASMKAGRNFRNEEAAFEVVIWVESVGGTPAVAGTRALVLGLALEEYVADNKNGIGGAQWLLVQGGNTIQEAAIDQGSIAELVYTIAYKARLT